MVYYLSRKFPKVCIICGTSISQITITKLNFQCWNCKSPRTKITRRKLLKEDLGKEKKQKGK